MTISSTSTRKQYAGDNVSTSFATSPVTYYAGSDLQVRVITNATGAFTLLSQGTHYSVVSNAPGSGGSMTGSILLNLGSSPWGALLTGTTLDILRVLPVTQTTDLVNNASSDAEVQEQIADRAAMIDQQNAETLSRAIQFPVPETAFSGVLPNAATRAGKAVFFDGTGALAVGALIGVMTTTIVGQIPFGAAGNTLAQDANLVWDNVNKRLGVGVAAPTQALDILGTGKFSTSIVTPVVDSGTAGTLSLKTNSGTEQVQILHTTAASNKVTITGANGGNPTLGVTGGNLAITPTVVFGGLITVGTTGSTFVCDTTSGGAKLNIRRGRDIGAGSLDAVGLDALDTALTSQAPMAIRASAITLVGPTAIGGTTTNDNAATGQYGEFITAGIGSGSAVSLTTNTPANITSITLGAGDWDVTGVVSYQFGATTSYTNLIGDMSATTATLDGIATHYFDYETAAQVPTAGSDQTWSLPTARFSLSTSTTIFLVAQATFTVSTLKAYGNLRARRVR